MSGGKVTRIAGIEAATTDVIVTGPAGALREILARHGLAAAGVGFTEDTARVARAADALAARGRRVQAAGGTIANTLCAWRRWAAGGEQAALEVSWCGVAPCRAFEDAEAPLPSLRRRGVVPYLGRAPDAGRARERSALIAVDEATGGVLAIALCPPELPLAPAAAWPRASLVVLTLERAAGLAGPLARYVEAAGAVALLVADAALDRRARAALRRQGASGRLRALVGKRSELAALGVDLAGEPPPYLRRCDLVGTDGAGAVVVWDGAEQRWHRLPVPLAERRPPDGNDLGLGDAYAGAFLAARHGGLAVADAHHRGAAAAREARAAPTARPAAEEDLSRLFGPRLAGRESARADEGRLFATVRRTCGIAVVSCGQTGVDQLGLAAAARLGLPSFAILPAGRRTEAAEGLVAGRDDFAGAAICELASPSYRFCTWTNVFCADGSLLFDYRGSEGSAETRLACRALGRPFLDLAPLDLGAAVAAAAAWAETHGIRVVHLAGNRASRLEPGEAERVRRQATAVLRALACRRAAAAPAPPRRPRPAPAAAGPGRYERLRLGLPNTAESRGLAVDFLAALGAGGALEPRRRLHHVLAALDLEIFLVRARDLAAMLDRDLLDAALLGSDLVAEYRPAAQRLLDTGLEPCLLVLLGRDGGPWPPAAIGSQYPHLAATWAAARAPVRRVEELRGTAEAWLATGFIGGVLDTWRTGATAGANDLELKEVLAATSLVLVARLQGTARRRRAARRLAADLGRWLWAGGAGSEGPPG